MKRNNQFVPFLDFVNTYSLLVALGSYSCFLFFSKVYQVEVSHIVGLGLALGVWFIYTLDHLLDGIKQNGKATTLRHQLHFTQKDKLIPVLGVVALALCVLAFFVPVSYYSIIRILVLLTIFHFVVNYLVPKRVQKFLFLKEVFIALVVAIGFCITPLAPVKFPLWPDSFDVVLKSLFFINVTNLLLFSYYDREADKLANTLSIAQLTSENTVRVLAQASILISFLFTSVGMWKGTISVVVWMVILAMQLSLVFILRNKDYFQANDRYRFFGDLIYVYPLFALPFLY